MRLSWIPYVGKIGIDYGCSGYVTQWMLAPILVREFQASASMTGINQSKTIAVRQGVFIQDNFSKKQKLALNLKLLPQKKQEERFSKVGVNSWNIRDKYFWGIPCLFSLIACIQKQASPNKDGWTIDADKVAWGMFSSHVHTETMQHRAFSLVGYTSERRLWGLLKILWNWQEAFEKFHMPEEKWRVFINILSKGNLRDKKSESCLNYNQAEGQGVTRAWWQTHSAVSRNHRWKSWWERMAIWHFFKSEVFEILVFENNHLGI